MMNETFADRVGISLPIIQAPMAGTSTPKMAAAVSNAGALGSIAVGAVSAAAARQMIRDVKVATDKPFNVNVFCHEPAPRDADVERTWLGSLRPAFERWGTEPPASLGEIYTSFRVDDDMLLMLLEERPRVVSFHFGLPGTDRIEALHAAGVFLLATATNLDEARAAVAAGVDAIVAQGFEAGGHRGVFDSTVADSQLGTVALVRVLRRFIDRPIIAAGGIMDGAAIAAMHRLGAAGAQLGTAFIGCPESSADDGHRAALASDAAQHTIMTRVISGRSARCLRNLFTEMEHGLRSQQMPAYPVAYDAGKALNAAAKAKGEFGFGAQWAGQGAPLARSLPAADLVQTLGAELAEASMAVKGS